MNTPKSLSALLSFKPLDSLQIATTRELHDSSIFTRTYRNELSWVYFQRCMPDGRIEVMTPSGYALSVDATEICDVRPARPVHVRAMPKIKFLERLALPLKDRQAAAGPESYSDAMVLFAMKNAYGQFDYSVQFLDPAYRADSMRQAPIAHEDRVRLKALTRRSVMPVQSSKRYGTGVVADHGAGADQRRAKMAFGKFLASRLSGSHTAVCA